MTRRLPHLAAPRPQPLTQPGRSTHGPDAPIREAGAGASRLSGCHVSEATGRYQYTAIDDATQILALSVYARHTQKNVIRFLGHVIDACPLRIHTVRTDRGHEFQRQSHWHLTDRGIRHVYIRPRTPRLKGKVKRSHRTDKQEFYQRLTYTGDVDLNTKLAEWEHFYNDHRPHGAFQGKTPYEALLEKLG